MSQEALLYAVHGPCATITLNRPTRGNALNPDLQAAFLARLDEAGKDDLIHFVVLRALGKYFCTGMDLGASGSSLSGDNELAYRHGREFFEALESFPKPLITVADGPCMGGGCGIFFLGDIRIASRGTYFQLTEVTRGLVPALISPTIVKEWGVPLAKDAMLSARRVSADELRSNGALQHLCETATDVEATLRTVCKDLQKGGPKALQRTKLLIRTQATSGLCTMPPHAPSSVQAQDALRAAFLDMMGPSEEAIQGIMTFRESKGKRDVDWLEYYKSKL